MILFLLLTSLSISLLTGSITHPISFMVIIIMQALFICMASSILVSTPWFAFILFLIFLGGVMVLFVYMSSLASNENFLLDIKELTLKSVMIIAVTIFIAMIYPSFFLFIDNKMMTIIYPIYSLKFSNLLICFIFYLLVTLLIVSDIMKKNKSPMRSMK